MPSWTSVADWLRSLPPVLWWWIGAASIVTFMASTVVLPLVVIRMAPDYFLESRDPDLTFRRRHPVWRWTGLIVKNALGLVLFLAGVVLCFTPGQGLLTMLMGIALMDFPGKRALERALVRRPGIAKALNWIRARAGREPLLIP
jgi:hypothetical protein